MAITSPNTAQGRPAFADREADDAFEATFETHWSWVCSTLYRLVGDWDEAEDLSLQVFCRLRQRPPKDPEKVANWLYRVATNAGLNALRARKRRRKYEESAATLRWEHDHPVDPAVETERGETRQRVRQVLAHMKPRAAQLLILRHSGLSYAEIAATLDIAPGSVGTLLARAEQEFERRYRALEESDETP
jgi:RNA polymerase sigma-70 factor (ECF subfamily)